MFPDQQKRSSGGKSKRKGAVAGDPAVTILTSSCHFEGKLYCKGASRIGGRIQGKVISEGLLIIEEEARLNAEIVVDEVVVQGQVSGKLRATKRVELRETSRFQGEITSPALIIREGAQFDGRVTMAETNTELADAKLADAGSEPELHPGHELPDSGGKIPDVTIVNTGG